MKKINFNVLPFLFWDLLLILIITLPAFISLLKPGYFSMHDDQHIVRLFLLEKGVKQGYFFPRWVDGLGFGYGYPLFNFYPPLIYYVALFFRLIGISLIWSIKLLCIGGFLLAALGMFVLVKKLTSRLPALLASCLYTYFFYHAVNIYVRGALAEFFSMAILPYIILCFINLYEQTTLKHSLRLGIAIGLLILTHPLIAFPAVFYWLLLSLFLFVLKDKARFLYLRYLLLSALFSLSLSAFFWLPSLVERKFTLVEAVLTKELANYQIHFVSLSQLWQSRWDYGGSGPNLADGMTFQLGKIHLFLVLISLIGAGGYFLRLKKDNRLNVLNYYFFFLALFLVSVFMTLDYSFFIWRQINYLWYLQFPWRFLTFAALFIALIGGYGAFFLLKLQPVLGKISIFILVITTVFIYQKYFHPNQYLLVQDADLITPYKIQWQVSRSSFEFIPAQVKTRKSFLHTTIPAIEENDLPARPIIPLSGQGEIQVLRNDFQNKVFLIKAQTEMKVQINTFNFPGWELFLNREKIMINDQNDLKLITFAVAPGSHQIDLKFTDTPIREIANLISLIGFFAVMIAYFFAS